VQNIGQKLLINRILSGKSCLLFGKKLLIVREKSLNIGKKLLIDLFLGYHLV